MCACVLSTFMCFSHIHLCVRKQWVPEVRHFCPGVPFVLVGCKSDLRDDPATIAELKKNGQHPVTDEEGAAVAAKIGAFE